MKRLIEDFAGLRLRIVHMFFHHPCKLLSPSGWNQVFISLALLQRRGLAHLVRHPSYENSQILETLMISFYCSTYPTTFSV
jgi:hypothetical protein